jgi:hypothetical protein
MTGRAITPADGRVSNAARTTHTQPPPTHASVGAGVIARQA